MTWEVGQTVEVQSRTWAGINKPGGCAKITKIHYDAGSTVEGLDVKYVVSGGVEKNIDPAIVSAFETLQRGGRKRRGRDFLLDQAKDAKQKLVKSSKKNKTKKTKAPSPQPTSPSTPTTSPGQQRKQQQQPKATKVTPIPSYVIANQIMDVSPLDRNCNPSTEQSKQPLARRGLFETTNVPPATAVRTKEEKQAAAAVASYLFNSSSEEKRKSIIKSANLKPPAVYETPATNNNDNNHRKANRMPLHTTTSMRASVAKLQLPRPQPKTAANSKSVPLRRVFQKEVQKAREFIDTVMGARSEDLIHDHQQEAEEEVVVKAPAPPSRFDQFLSIFRVIRLRIDDGTIDETEFEKLVNAQAETSASTTKPYSKEEVEAHLETLSGQGKVMKSEGTIYIID